MRLLPTGRNSFKSIDSFPVVGITIEHKVIKETTAVDENDNFMMYFLQFFVFVFGGKLFF